MKDLPLLSHSYDKVSSFYCSDYYAVEIVVYACRGVGVGRQQQWYIPTNAIIPTMRAPIRE